MESGFPNGKNDYEQLAASRSEGMVASSEKEGLEHPGSLFSALDAGKETAVGILLLSIFLRACHFAGQEIFWIGLLFTCGWSLWKGGRGAWLAWSRLEHLHRIVAKKRYDIDHHRKQERSSLTTLYAAKGFKNNLLNEVVDVLMADDERLLRVIVEEKLGLTLEKSEHPLKQGFGAFLGAFLGGIFMLAGYFFLSETGLLAMGLLIVLFSAGWAARLEENRILPAVVWNGALLLLVYGMMHFLFLFLTRVEKIS